MGEGQASGYVEGLFDRAKAVKLEDLMARLGIAVEAHGEELRGICPIPAHKGDKKSQSFYINPLEQVFHCFGCKAGGNIVKFAQAYKPMVLVAYKPINTIVLAGLIVMGMHFLQAG